MNETNVPTSASSVKALGGMKSFLLFLVALTSFVFQSSLTQFVQGDLGFRQPYFLMYIAHSSFMVIFPIHLLYLKISTGKSFKTFFIPLRRAIVTRLALTDGDYTTIPLRRFTILIFVFTAGINFPTLLWYIAVSLASISDVTAIWNTNSLWVYVLCVLIYRMKWELTKLGAVLLACVGVVCDVYGGSRAGHQKVRERDEGLTAPVIGQMLTLIGSMTYGLYQVLYKRYVALSDDPEEGYRESGAPFEYESIPDDEGEHSQSGDDSVKDVHPLPFGLYPNLFTSCLGLCNALVMAIGFPILHWFSIEGFRLPPDLITFWSVVGIAVGGVLFNSCFMILLGVWGPILTSVGNLLTIVLILITDVLLTHSGVTMWSVFGAGMIVSAFAVLAFDMIQTK